MKRKTHISIAAIFLLLSAAISPLWITKITKAVNGAKLTGNVYDYGLDTDGDGLYNYLVAKLEVNVATAGTYTLQVSGLGDEYQYVWIGVSNTTYLNTGSQNISVRFLGAVIQQSKINVTKLVNIQLYDKNYHWWDYRQELSLSKTYKYSEFDEPGAKFTNVIYDNGVDTDGDGLFNYLNISIKLNVTEFGIYEVSINGLYNATYNYVNVYGNTQALLSPGTRYLNVFLEGWII
ncbi:MAG: hypothetical protein QXK86_08595, partial [Candidatus Bathyarchaeia archaeon]